MSNIVEVEYNGTVSVCCERCDSCFEVRFTGSEMALDEVIDGTLEELGWSEGICPPCLDKGDEYISEEEDGEDY